MSSKYFRGGYTHKVDAKGRVSLPVAYRNTLEELGSEQVVLLPQYLSPDYHVGMSEAAHSAEIEKIEKNPNLSAEKKRKRLRKLSGRAILLQPDDAGRIVLSRELRAKLGIGNEVHFQALGPYFEIWHPARFDEVLGDEDEDEEDDDEPSDLMGTV